MTPYLSSAGAWALALGCTIGWGAFVMPGTTFLPVAGPLGSLIGLSIGALIMVLFGSNYTRLIKRYPGAGGSYTYAKALLGGDHGFLCGWMLLLAYIAILWANATAITLILRSCLGDIFCFGFCYQVFSYDVYLGELLLSAFFVILGAAICILSRNLSKWLQIICVSIPLVGMCTTFVAVVIHRGGLSGLAPLFRETSSPTVQVISVILLAPWAFLGFESISHSAGEFRFSKKKTFPIMVLSILAALICYATLAICACCVHPDGYDGWLDYISDLSQLEGVAQIPTFYSAQEALGTTGLVILAVSAVCAVMSSIIGLYVATSRLMYAMAFDKMLPRVFARQNKRGTPYMAIMITAAISCVVPFFGRTAIGWIVDVVTIGATVVYAYISICNVIIGLREKKRMPVVWGALGAVISVSFVIFYLIPSFRINTDLASQSYMILILWSVMGIVVFRILVGKDKKRRLGKNGVVWIVLLLLILLVSISWIVSDTAEENVQVGKDIRSVYYQSSYSYRTAPNEDVINKTGDYISRRMTEFGNTLKRNYYIQAGILLFSAIIIFSIFSMIRKRESHLDKERIQAVENSRAKTIFLSNMSHDIRTPMNAITGYTALALREEDVPDKVRDYLEKINFSSKHLLSLINDILDMSRIEHGKVELHNAPANLITLVDEIYNLFALQMESKKLTFTVDYSKVTDPNVICDKHRLNRILANLVSNAYKFTPEGGSVTLTLLQNGKHHGDGVYELIVADTGVGMSKEFLEHVFDAFERERNDMTEKTQGTGLGMSIAKSLVDMMGGTISVESEQNKGTTFTILLTLPISEIVEQEHHPEEAMEEQTSFVGKTVLVVEDNPINSEIASEILGHAGLKVDLAENGRIGLEKMIEAQDDTYALILMDIQMPEMNGYEAAKAIRDLPDPAKASIPIIAITANSFDTDREKAREAGMNSHISKPFDPVDLVATISKYIR
ncbi:MAG: amino acid permease [Ruminococcus sp.]|nr:amino acid permease [Ruminococcus sp.]